MTASLRRCLALVGTLLLLAAGPPAATAQLPGTSPTADTTDKDVPYVPTAPSVVTRMLEVADVSETDVVYDLGSGDGRIPIAAAEQFGARAFGVEIDSGLVAKARAGAREAGVEDLVTFRRGDLFNVDLHDATVVTLYLWPEINVRLRPKLLRQLDPGDRIVSHDFRMGDWEPDRVVDAGQGNTGEETIYLWVVPEEVPADLLDISDEPEVN
jgi:protein-L-isoaspartate O-methyltransferase